MLDPGRLVDIRSPASNVPLSLVTGQATPANPSAPNRILVCAECGMQRAAIAIWDSFAAKDGD
jgi:hypothetical protein